MKKLAIRISGKPEWRRFLIAQEGGRFWNGRRWTRHRQHARLYADDQDVALEFRVLEDRLYKDKRLRTLQVPLTIRLRADQEIDLDALGVYLQRAVAIVIDQDRYGTGPITDSLVQLDVTWADMREVLPEEKRGKR